MVLGDSLSDTGNAGRFCNGPVWVELLARELGLPLRPARLGGTNFAVGGARISGGDSDLAVQAAALRERAGGELDPLALYVVYAGGNDVLAAMMGLGFRRAAIRSARGLAGIVAELAEMGACSFLVPNLPDLGLTPVAARFPRPVAQIARSVTQTFNAELEQALGEVEASRAVAIRRLDVFGEVDAMTAGDSGGADRSLLFCDSIHPAAEVHRHIAALAFRCLEQGTAWPARGYPATT
ncbi:MAG: SGNH/GDSL hydrolase family protein [Geminicoccaceae bacterium]